MKKNRRKQAEAKGDVWYYLRRFYVFYGNQHKFVLFMLFLGAVFSGVLEVVGIVGLYLMVRLLVNVEALHNDHVLSRVFSYFGLITLNEKIAVFGLLIALIFIGKNIYIMAFYYFEHHTLKKWRSAISAQFMRSYLNASYLALLGYSSATIVRNINSTVSSALNGFLLSAFNFFANILSGLIILTLIYIKYFKVSLLIAGILIISTWLQSRYLKRKAIEYGRERDNLIEESDRNVYQGIHAIKETKVMGKEEFFMAAFNSLNEKTIDNESKNDFLTRLPKHITEITIIVAILLICVAVLSDRSLSTDASVASLGALAAIAFRIAPIMNRTLGYMQSMNKNLGSIDTMFKEFEKLEKINENKIETARIKVNFSEQIRFENVSFTYPKSKKPAVDGVSFSVTKGSFVGIVGASGAGKSTLVDMILGLLHPKSGFIWIDDTRLDEKSRRSWQDMLAFVPQNIYLSDDSIANNVAFGVDAATIDVARVEAVLKKVQLWDLVASKPDGVNFKVGESGKNLSGGQKQRLSLARALYCEAPVILLDEATSALDLKTEFEISNLLYSNRGQRTIIAVAHRLTTVYAADNIIFMEQGRIVDQGTFEELRMRNDGFSELAKLARIT